MYMLLAIDALVLIGLFFFKLLGLFPTFFTVMVAFLLFKGAIFFLASKDIASAIDMIVASYFYSLLYWSGLYSVTFLCIFFLVQKNAMFLLIEYLG